MVIWKGRKLYLLGVLHKRHRSVTDFFFCLFPVLGADLKTAVPKCPDGIPDGQNTSVLGQ